MGATGDVAALRWKTGVSLAADLLFERKLQVAFDDCRFRVVTVDASVDLVHACSHFLFGRFRVFRSFPKELQVSDRVNLYQLRAPSIRFFLANGWESTNLKDRNQAVRDLIG